MTFVHRFAAVLSALLLLRFAGCEVKNDMRLK